jgi:hypothetical protein
VQPSPKHAGEKLISVTNNIPRYSVIFIYLLEHQLSEFLGRDAVATRDKVNHACKEAYDDRQAIIGPVPIL